MGKSWPGVLPSPSLDASDDSEKIDVADTEGIQGNKANFAGNAGTIKNHASFKGASSDENQNKTNTENQRQHSDDGTEIKKNNMDKTSFRNRLGIRLGALSDVVNSNLIIARYATMSTIALLVAYGLANTPFFLRFKHVADIPKVWFWKRKWIYGRIVGVVTRTDGGSVGFGGSCVRDTADGTNIAGLPSNKAMPFYRSASSSHPQRNYDFSRGPSSLLSSQLQKAACASHSQEIQHQTFESTNNSSSTVAQGVPDSPVIVLVRHSSPMERLLPQSVFKKLISVTGNSSLSPPSSVFSSSTYKNLLQIELAGASLPSSIELIPSNRLTLLDQLVRQKARVSLQLLARRTTAINSNCHTSRRNHDQSSRSTNVFDDHCYTTAICHMHYRQPKQWFFTTNVSQELIKKGEAWVNPSGMLLSLSSSSNKGRDLSSNPSASEAIRKTLNIQQKVHHHDLIEAKPSIKQLQFDAQFVSELEKAEYNAWKSELGLWSNPSIKDMRKEYYNENTYLEKWKFLGGRNILEILSEGFRKVRGSNGSKRA